MLQENPIFHGKIHGFQVRFSQENHSIWEGGCQGSPCMRGWMTSRNRGRIRSTWIDLTEAYTTIRFWFCSDMLRCWLFWSAGTENLGRFFHKKILEVCFLDWASPSSNVGSITISHPQSQIIPSRGILNHKIQIAGDFDPMFGAADVNSKYSLEPKAQRRQVWPVPSTKRDQHGILVFWTTSWAPGWWFGTWLLFSPIVGNNHPNWLIYFRGVQTTNQAHIFDHMIYTWGFTPGSGSLHPTLLDE